jgi:flagellar secretion chaperone FliS
MTTNEKLNVYKRDRVTSANNIEAVGLLYEEAIIRLRRAKEKYAIADQTFKDDIAFAQKIVQGLSMILDFKQGKEIAENLFAIYYYIDKRLLVACEGIKLTPSYCDEATQMLSKLHESWQTVIDNEKAEIAKNNPKKPTTGGLEISI